MKIQLPRTRRLNRLFGIVSDLYEGERESFALELRDRTSIVTNEHTVNGLGRSGALAQALWREYRSEIRRHEEFLITTLQRVFESDRFLVKSNDYLRITKYLKDHLDSLAARYENQVRQYKQSAGLSGIADLGSLGSGTESRIRGEISVMAADLRQKIVLPWYERPVVKLFLAAVTTVFGAVCLWLVSRILGVSL
jgi:hypothetical protein